MAMKKHEALEAVRKALAQQRRFGDTPVAPLHTGPATPPPPTSAGIAPRTPDFEFCGWQFFALTSKFEDEPLEDGGDAKLRSPDGRWIGLAWSATGSLYHRFDLTNAQVPMLYVDVPASVAKLSDLRPYFEALVPALQAAMR
jgi:hypothetical protein